MERVKNVEVQKSRTKDMIGIGMCAAIMAVCSWFYIPMAVPFTLQTLAVFITVGLLGGKKGALSVLVYIMLGAIGLPVFHGFTGGVGILLGTTGGYIIGFVFLALVYWLITAWLGQKTWVIVLGMTVGIAVCYMFGTAWFMYVYAQNTGAIGLMTALSWCVIPFIIPDLVKIAVAVIIVKRVSQHVNF